MKTPKALRRLASWSRISIFGGYRFLHYFDDHSRCSRRIRQAGGDGEHNRSDDGSRAAVRRSTDLFHASAGGKKASLQPGDPDSWSVHFTSYRYRLHVDHDV